MNEFSEIFENQIKETYDVIGEIGKGGGGTVYEGYHKRLRKKVVLKKQHEAIRGLVNERTETDTLKNLRHSFLPQVLDFIVTDKSIFTVMDYIPGRSLKEILDEKGKLSEEETIKYAKQLCEALVYLHNSNPPVIHGDIKPDNIMVTPEDNICLIDFNISSALGAANSYAFGYTLGYAAPEQKQSFEFERNRLKSTGLNTGGINSADNEKTLLLSDIEDKTEIINSESNDTRDEDIGIVFDRRSDIFSYGATLYHMLTGIKPSSDLRNVKPVTEFYPLMNKGLADIITKSMYADPNDRFQSFDEVKKILDNIKKYDIRYKAKVTRRIITAAALAVALGTFSAIALTSLKRNNIAVYQGKLDEALAEYYASEYEESINTITDELINKYRFGIGDEYKAIAYYLRANDCSELSQYEYAIEDYKEALSLGGYNEVVYRDYAITLAKSGNTNEALDILNIAKGEGIADENISLAEAEIESVSGNTEKAIELFKECIKSTGDDDTLYRAYVECVQLFDTHDIEDLKQSTKLLEDAEGKITGTKALAILEMLAQRYVLIAEYENDNTYYEKALSVFNRISEKGWDTYLTHNNMAIVYEQIGDLEKAEDELSIMQSEYPENYNTYKRMAFLEIDMQNERVSAERDYSDFKEYYEKALSLYQSRNVDSDDVEMKLLNELYI